MSLHWYKMRFLRAFLMHCNNEHLSTVTITIQQKRKINSFYRNYSYRASRPQARTEGDPSLHQVNFDKIITSTPKVATILPRSPSPFKYSIRQIQYAWAVRVRVRSMRIPQSGGTRGAMQEHVPELSKDKVGLGLQDLRTTRGD